MVQLRSCVIGEKLRFLIAFPVRDFGILWDPEKHFGLFFFPLPGNFNFFKKGGCRNGLRNYLE